MKRVAKRGQFFSVETGPWVTVLIVALALILLVVLGLIFKEKIAGILVSPK